MCVGTNLDVHLTGWYKMCPEIYINFMILYTSTEIYELHIQYECFCVSWNSDVGHFCWNIRFSVISNMDQK